MTTNTCVVSKVIDIEQPTHLWISKVIDVEGKVVNPNETFNEDYIPCNDGFYICHGQRPSIPYGNEGFYIRYGKRQYLQYGKYFLDELPQKNNEISMITYESISPKFYIIKLPISSYIHVNYYLQYNSSSENIRKIITFNKKEVSMYDCRYIENICVKLNPELNSYITNFNTYHGLKNYLKFIKNKNIIFVYNTQQSMSETLQKLTNSLLGLEYQFERPSLLLQHSTIKEALSPEQHLKVSLQNNKRLRSSKYPILTQQDTNEL